MRNISVGGALKLAFIFAWIFSSAPSNANISVQIDQFTVEKVENNVSTAFTDTFFNNKTPSQENFYSVLGTFPNGAESGGLLTLNSNWGAFSQNALGQGRQTLLTTLLSNNELNVNSTFNVNGIFNLVTPTGPLSNGYGVRVTDALLQGQSVPDRLLELDVQYSPAEAQDVIRFLLQDFANNTVTTLGFVPFVPGNADQIDLMISRPDSNNNDFYGAYAFGTSGIFDQFTTFASPGALFTNTDFALAQFVAFTAVPEPGTLALLGLGFAGLAASRRRKE